MSGSFLNCILYKSFIGERQYKASDLGSYSNNYLKLQILITYNKHTRCRETLC